MTAAAQQSGDVQMLGIVQEQHPDRARLFMQWKQMDWPVMVDSLNLLNVSVVPITLLIDERGIVRRRVPPRVAPRRRPRGSMGVRPRRRCRPCRCWGRTD